MTQDPQSTTPQATPTTGRHASATETPQQSVGAAATQQSAGAAASQQSTGTGTGTGTPTSQSSTASAAPQLSTSSSPYLATIAEYSEYPEAQAAVDRLSDNDFEVGAVRIVGHDLTSVEAVSGRMTYGRSALYGAGSGAWLGLLIGLLMSIFLIGAFFGPVIWSIIIGAVWGAIFGLIAFAATGNARNFSSRTAMTAGRYSVEVPTDRADAALQILSQRR